MATEYTPDRFPYIREHFFRDPAQNGPGVFANAAQTLLEGIARPDDGSTTATVDAHPLVAAAADIASTYRSQDRHFDHLSVAQLHPAGNYIGERGVAALLNHTLDMAAEFAEAISRSDYALKLSFEPELNTVCAELKEDGTNNNQVLECVSSELDQQSIYLSTISLPYRDGRPGTRKVLRFVATHPYTGSAEIAHSAEAVQLAVKAVCGE